MTEPELVVLVLDRTEVAMLANQTITSPIVQAARAALAESPEDRDELRRASPQTQPRGPAESDYTAAYQVPVEERRKWGLGEPCRARGTGNIDCYFPLDHIGRHSWDTTPSSPRPDRCPTCPGHDESVPCPNPDCPVPGHGRPEQGCTCRLHNPHSDNLRAPNCPVHGRPVCDYCAEYLDDCHCGHGRPERCPTCGSDDPAMDFGQDCEWEPNENYCPDPWHSR